jgi:uncharacterized protein (DUF488 family)
MGVSKPLNSMNQESISESSSHKPLTIYTIGHSNVPASALISLLQQYEIQVLVDVRSSPYSQYAYQFNKEALQAALQEAGIQYRFAGDFLGGRPKDPTCYKMKELPDGEADYLHLVDYTAVMTKVFFQKGIQRLLELAGDYHVVVMCSEEDPAQCHRHHLIGKYLIQNGVVVLHIRGNGYSVKDEQLPNLPEEPPAKQLPLF